eukprot:gene9602-15730_t
MSLMTGMATDADQLVLIETLLEMAEVVVEHQVSGATLSATIQHDTVLLDALCDEDVENMLSPECELLPPDLTQRCAPSSRELRDLNALQAETDAIERLVAEKEALLYKHQTKATKHGGVVTVTSMNERSNRIHLARTLAVHSETMSQLVESFIRSCSTELRDLMKARPKSQAQADVGAAVLRAKMKLESFNKSMRLVNHQLRYEAEVLAEAAHVRRT